MIVSWALFPETLTVSLLTQYYSYICQIVNECCIYSDGNNASVDCDVKHYAR